MKTTSFVMVALSLLLSGSAMAAGGDSSYRVVNLEPSPKGAWLVVGYTNQPGGGKAAQGTRIEASFAVYTANPQGGIWVNNKTSDAYKTGDLHKPGAISVGRFADWQGTGVTKVELDYAKLGLKAGQQIWTGVNFFWGTWGHSWGDTVAGRGAGGPHVLPACSAQQNSRLSRAAGRSWRGALGRPVRLARPIGPGLCVRVPARRR